MYNKITILGNLGADPDYSVTRNDNKVCELSVATNDYQDDEPNWHDVTVWGNHAENCRDYLSKGDTVLVEGRVKYQSWEGDDGNMRYSTAIIANEVKFLGDREQSADVPDASDVDVQESEFEEDDLPF